MCNCIDMSVKALEEKKINTSLVIPITFRTDGKVSADRLTVGTEKRDFSKREKPVTIFASFCPFCGEKYPD